jgi:hypothetical protein
MCEQNKLTGLISDKRLILACDASSQGFGGILFQFSANKNEFSTWLKKEGEL